MDLGETEHDGGVGVFPVADLVAKDGENFVISAPFARILRP